MTRSASTASRARRVSATPKCDMPASSSSSSSSAEYTLPASTFDVISAAASLPAVPETMAIELEPGVSVSAFTDNLKQLSAGGTMLITPDILQDRKPCAYVREELLKQTNTPELDRMIKEAKMTARGCALHKSNQTALLSAWASQVQSLYKVNLDGLTNSHADYKGQKLPHGIAYKVMIGLICKQEAFDPEQEVLRLTTLHNNVEQLIQDYCKYTEVVYDK